MLKIENCENNIIHEDKVNNAINNLNDDYLNFKLAELFKMFGDETRIKILNALEAGELCVCDISAILKMSQSSISHQLRILREGNLVNYEKRGKVVYYFISDEHVNDILNIGCSHLKEML